jgi:pimeloyl-ACP methyl ester carboxylesterase
MLLVALVSGAVVAVGILLAWSRPGRPRPFLDERGHVLPHSLSEKIRITINGVEQGMFVRARDDRNPVLLYLHGGLPDYCLTHRYPTGLEDDFVVCWWEQRGTGLSYDRRASARTISTEQLISDGLAVSEYLRRRFGQERIYLLGHSGGTFIGIHMAATAPALFHAYVGVAQMANQLRSEARAFEYMLAAYRLRGDVAMVRKLEAAPVSADAGIPPKYLAIRDAAMHGLGIGTTRGMRSVVTGVVLESLRNRDYTLSEKLNLWRGKASAGVSSVWNEMLATNLAEAVSEVAIPVYFVHGVHDHTCSYSEAAFYFDRLAAPLKGFYTFGESAHSPMFEEPEKLRTILREDVLQGTNRLADGPARVVHHPLEG